MGQLKSVLSHSHSKKKKKKNPDVQREPLVFLCGPIVLVLLQSTAEESLALSAKHFPSGIYIH